MSSKTKDNTMEINIGINKGHRKAIAGGLSKVLADSYLLYL